MTIHHFYNAETDAAMDKLLREFFKPVSTSCTSRTINSISRDEALHKVWRVERDCGPPIPDRRFDWTAIDYDTYDIGSPIGYGATEREAIMDLLEKIEEAA